MTAAVIPLLLCVVVAIRRLGVSLHTRSNHANDLCIVGKAASRVFGEYELAVGTDVEHAALARHELRFNAEFAEKPGLQTGGAW
jgi:hypothetical protein